MPDKPVYVMQTRSIKHRTQALGVLAFRPFNTLDDVAFLTELDIKAGEDNRRFVTGLLIHQALSPKISQRDLAKLSDRVLLGLGKALVSETAGIDAPTLRNLGDCRSVARNHTQAEIAQLIEAMRPVVENAGKAVRSIGISIGRMFSQTYAQSLNRLGQQMTQMYSPASLRGGSLVGHISNLSLTAGHPPTFGRIPPVLSVTPRSYAIEPPTSGPHRDKRWVKVDRQLDSARQRLGDASAEEDFQSVGLLCREAMISLAAVVYDRTLHPPIDGTEPSSTDAKRRLEAYVMVKLGGPKYESLRRTIRAVVDQAVALQHDRDADKASAAICFQVTLAAVEAVTIIEESSSP